MNRKQKRVVIGMSGGVDSSVAALLLKQQGFEVIGLSLKLYDLPPEASTCGKSCCSPEELTLARRVADQLGIRFFVLNAKQLFSEQILHPFVKAYLAGETPNPCIVCNQRIKFDHLLQRAKALDADYLATGHYARILRNAETGLFELWRARGVEKDQSYFLSRLNQQQLGSILFPLAELDKKRVRKLAAEHSLTVANKPESQEICFVGEKGVGGYIEHHSAKPAAAGKIIHVRAGEIGEHGGIHHFTIGQRKGLGVAWTEPLYVVAIDAAKHAIFVAERKDLGIKSFTVRDLHWISGDWPKTNGSLQVKIRSRGQAFACSVKGLADGAAEVVFAQAADSVTPGQAAVFYNGDQLIGGGWIATFQAEKAWPMYPS